MEKTEPENTTGMVVDACSDCDVCRFLMDSERIKKQHDGI